MQLNALLIGVVALKPGAGQGVERSGNCGFCNEVACNQELCRVDLESMEPGAGGNRRRLDGHRGGACDHGLRHRGHMAIHPRPGNERHTMPGKRGLECVLHAGAGFSLHDGNLTGKGLAPPFRGRVRRSRQTNAPACDTKPGVVISALRLPWPMHDGSVGPSRCQRGPGTHTGCANRDGGHASFTQQLLQESQPWLTTGNDESMSKSCEVAQPTSVDDGVSDVPAVPGESDGMPGSVRPIASGR